MYLKFLSSRCSWIFCLLAYQRRFPSLNGSYATKEGSCQQIVRDLVMRSPTSSGSFVVVLNGRGRHGGVKLGLVGLPRRLEAVLVMKVARFEIRITAVPAPPIRRCVCKEDWGRAYDAHCGHCRVVAGNLQPGVAQARSMVILDAISPWIVPFQTR